MIDIIHLTKKQSPAIRLKIMVQTDGIDFRMYLLSKTFQFFKWYMTRLTKHKINWRRGKQCASPITLGGWHNNWKFRVTTQNCARFVLAVEKDKKRQEKRLPSLGLPSPWTRCRPFKRQRCISDVVLKNEGSMGQNLSKHNSACSNTDSYMLRPTAMFIDSMRKRTYQSNYSLAILKRRLELASL